MIKKCLVGFRHLYRCPDTDEVWTMTSAKVLFINTITSVLPEFNDFCKIANFSEWHEPSNQKIEMLWYLTDIHVWRKKVELSNLPTK